MCFLADHRIFFFHAVTDSLLKDLAREIGSQWRNLGELLKVSSTFLNRRPTQRHLTDSDTAKAMLLEWKKKKKDNATEAALQKVLQEAQMYPLWEKVKGKHLKDNCIETMQFVKKYVSFTPTF